MTTLTRKLRTAWTQRVPGGKYVGVWRDSSGCAFVSAPFNTRAAALKWALEQRKGAK